MEPVDVDGDLHPIAHPGAARRRETRDHSGSVLLGAPLQGFGGGGVGGGQPGGYGGSQDNDPWASQPAGQGGQGGQGGNDPWAGQGSGASDEPPF